MVATVAMTASLHSRMRKTIPHSFVKRQWRFPLWALHAEALVADNRCHVAELAPAADCEG